MVYGRVCMRMVCVSYVVCVCACICVYVSVYVRVISTDEWCMVCMWVCMHICGDVE